MGQSISSRHIGEETKAEAIALYRAGHRVRWIAGQLGIPYKAFFGILHERGEPLRGRVPREQKIEERPDFTGRQWEIINGSLLGDASIAAPERANCRFSKGQTERHREYQEWLFAELLPYSKALQPFSQPWPVWVNGRIEKDPSRRLHGTEFRTSASVHFNALRQKWYPGGVKVVPPDIRLTPLAVAVWYCDDGCNCPDMPTAYFSTDCFTKQECHFLADGLRELGIKSGVYPYLEPRYRITVLRSSYHDFLDMVRPFIPWGCFAHKVRVGKPRPQGKKRQDAV